MNAGALSAQVTSKFASDGGGRTRQAGPYPMGMMAILATVAMLFAAFTAALLVRRTGTDWVPIRLPSIVLANTVLLIASSAAVEVARSAVRRDALDRAVGWLAVAGAGGFLFLMGQTLAWHTLAARGVLLPTNPHASFFYMLSAVHGAHLFGGLVALGWTLHRATHRAYTRTSHDGMTHTAIYWHFVGAVWIYLLILLSIL